METSLLTKGVFPADVCERAKEILTSCSGGSLGSYTDSRGISHVRESVAKFLSQRDHIQAKSDDVYLVNGASEGIKMVLLLCQMRGESAGVMIPIPQYPLYTATIAEQGAHPVSHCSKTPNIRTYGVIR